MRDQRLVEKPTIWLLVIGLCMVSAVNVSGERPATVQDVAAPGLTFKVLFDETHGVNADPWNGRYTIDEAYRDWADRLRRRSYEVVANRTQPLSASLLSGYKVCVIALPSSSLWPEEITALRDFVAGGGGLLLLPDAFGGGSVLNAVSETFGIRINTDVLADWDDSRPIRPVHFFMHTWPARNALTTHVDVVMYDWGSSLTLQPPAQAFGTGDANTWVDRNGNMQLDPGEEVGYPTGMAWSSYGNGKVVVIGDSNLFMNMYSQEFDNAQLSANVVDWLAGLPPVALDPNLSEGAHFRLSLPDHLTGFQGELLSKFEASHAFLRTLYGGDTRYPKSKVKLEASHPGCRSGCTNCIYNIWSDLSDPYLQGQPLVPTIYQPFLAELGHIYSGKYLGPLWLDTQYQWLGEGLGNWWTVPALTSIGYPDKAREVGNWITWAGQEYSQRGYTWISRWNQNNADQDRDLGYGMSMYIVRQLDRQYGNAMWRRLFDLIASNEHQLLALSDDQKNSYAVCFFDLASNDPQVKDVFTGQWHFQTDSILWATPQSVFFTHRHGENPQHARTMTLINCSTRQTLTWTIAVGAGAGWLSVDRQNGETPGSLSVTVNAGDLPPGVYQAAILVTAQPSSLGSPVLIPVTLLVSAGEAYLPLVGR